MFATGIFFAWYYATDMRWFLVFLLLVSIVFTDRYFFRFYLYSADLVQELAAAQTTAALGRWPIQLIGEGTPFFSIHPLLPGSLQNPYYSTLSVTEFPAIISKATGLSMIDTFRILIPLTISTTVLVVFQAARSIFNSKIAGLAALLYVLFVPNAFLREDVSVLFFFLTVYYVLKPRFSRPNLVVATACMSLIAVSHYGTFYFAIYGLLSIIIGRYILTRPWLRKINPFFSQLENYRGASKNFILFGAAVGLAWLFFIGFPIISFNAGEIKTSLDAIFDITSNRLSPFQTRVFASSLGPLTSISSWAQRLLVLAGAAIVFLRFKKHRSFLFTFFGLSMLFLVVVFAVVPNLADAIDLDRVLSYSLLAYSTLIAVAIFVMLKSKVTFTKLVAVILIILFVLGVANLPILYSTYNQLGTRQYEITYTQLITFYDQSDLQFAQWLGSYTLSTSTIATDQTGYWLLFNADRTVSQPTGSNVSQILDLITGKGSDYVAVLYYAPGFIEYTETNGTVVQLSPIQVTTLTNSSSLNLIYDNSKDVLFGHS